MLPLKTKSILVRLYIYKPLRKIYRIIRGTPIRRLLLPYRTLRFYRQFVPPESLCFDVGANVGIRTRTLRALGATVVAVEPQYECQLALQQKFGDDPNVIIEPVALGSRPGTGQLSLVDGMSPLASLADDWKLHGPFAHLFSHRTEAVPITTLDALIERHGMPTFIKIDVEGYEAQVISGLHRAPEYLSFEYVAHLINNAERCIALLGALGFTEYNYSSGETMAWRFPKWVSGGELITLLRDTKDSLSEWGDIYAHNTLIRPPHCQ